MTTTILDVFSNADLMNAIFLPLTIHNILNLRTASKSLYAVIEELISNRLGKCIKLIEDTWNQHADHSMNLARCKLDRYSTGPWTHKWIVDADEQLDCPHCSSQAAFDQYKNGETTDDQCDLVVHDTSISYTHFPRDVDILEWGINGKRVGYTMF